MKKLISFFAIALFLAIPLAANANMVGTADMALSWDGSYANVPYFVFYHGYISNATFPYSNNGKTVDLFCISGTTAASGTFDFNTITNNGTYTAHNGQPVTPTSSAVSEAAWVADYWQTYSSDRAMAQIAIWKILSVGDFTASYPQASAMVAAAGSHTDYATSNWYAAFDGQDYFVPVPEPGILILLGIALSAVGLASRRYKF